MDVTKSSAYIAQVECETYFRSECGKMYNLVKANPAAACGTLVESFVTKEAPSGIGSNMARYC